MLCPSCATEHWSSITHGSDCGAILVQETQFDAPGQAASAFTAFEDFTSFNAPLGGM
jgi:hypothetical protein